jgi:hypothetical protein
LNLDDHHECVRETREASCFGCACFLLRCSTIDLAHKTRLAEFLIALSATLAIADLAATAQGETGFPGYLATVMNVIMIAAKAGQVGWLRTTGHRAGAVEKDGALSIAAPWFLRLEFNKDARASGTHPCRRPR